MSGFGWLSVVIGGYWWLRVFFVDDGWLRVWVVMGGSGWLSVVGLTGDQSSFLGWLWVVLC